MGLHLRAFLPFYLVTGAGFTLLTGAKPLAYEMFVSKRLQDALDILINIFAWPYNLAFYFGPPGSGYGYVGLALALILLLVVWGVTRLFGEYAAGRGL